MSVLARLRSVASPQPKPATAVLVFESVRPLLEAHPLVAETGVDLRRVHAALVRLKTSESLAAPEPGRTARVPDCVVCYKGFVLLDAREGNRVCDRCGAVAASGVNVEPEYDAVVHSSAPHAPPWNAAAPELMHWNHFVGLSASQLETAAAQLRALSHERDLATVVAVLLHPTLAVPKEDALRDAVRRRVAIEEVDVATEPPRFACAACGALCHDGKSARFHCRAKARKRPR